MRRPREKPESFQLKSVKRKTKKKPKTETEIQAKVDVDGVYCQALQPTDTYRHMLYV